MMENLSVSQPSGKSEAKPFSTLTQPTARQLSSLFSKQAASSQFSHLAKPVINTQPSSSRQKTNQPVLVQTKQSKTEDQLTTSSTKQHGQTCKQGKLDVL